MTSLPGVMNIWICSVGLGGEHVGALFALITRLVRSANCVCVCVRV